MLINFAYVLELEWVEGDRDRDNVHGGECSGRVRREMCCGVACRGRPEEGDEGERWLVAGAL